MGEVDGADRRGSWPTCRTLRHRASDRKLRPFARAYCRSIWGLMGRASRAAIELGEEMAEGPVDEARREAVVRAAIEEVMRFPSMAGDRSFAADRAYRVACNDGWYAVEWTVGNGPELPDGARLLAEIFGDPGRPAAIDPAWSAAEVVAMARSIDAERAFDRMPMLGEALAGSGCAEPAILDHCRKSTGHVRGCWVVDAILGKG